MRSPIHPSAVALLSLPLLLAPVACKRGTPVPDDALASAVQSRLSGDGALASEPIQTGVQNGIVTLNGTVSNAAARSLAANDAAQVAGVRTVVNNLSVAPAPTTAMTAEPPVAMTAEPQPAANQAPPDRESRADRERDRKLAEKARQRDLQQQQARNTPSPIVRNTPPPVAAPTPAPIVQAPPPPPPAPVSRTITIPTGTVLPIRLTQTLDSATTQQGDTFSGSLASDVVIEGATVLRQGTAVSGRVTAVQEAAHFKGNSLLTVELTSATRRGERVALSTDPYSVQGKGRGKNTLEKTGGGAAVGAILGGIFGGGTGAAIGAAAGGGAGAGVNGITRGQQVQIAAETLVRFRLASPVPVRVSGSNNGNTPDTAPADPTLVRRPLSQ